MDTGQHVVRMCATFEYIVFEKIGLSATQSVNDYFTASPKSLTLVSIGPALK